MPLSEISLSKIPADEVPELQALKWAADPACKMPDAEQLDLKALRLLLMHHGLARRFAARAAQERPRWCSGVFLAVMRLAAREVEAGCRRHLAEMQEITRQFGTADAPPVLFKGGLAVYAVTGDPQTLRPSGDLDVLTSHSVCFSPQLQAAGYGEGETHAPHEEAVLYRNGITSEFHRHFVSTVCDPSVFLSTKSRAGTTPLEEIPPRRQALITYADVREDAAWGTAPGTEAIFVPSPAMLALLLCCHIFNHTVYTPKEHPIFDEPRVHLRLAEVADICALVRHPKFSAERFSQLCRRFEAESSVIFAAHLAAAYFGSAPAPLPESRGPLRLPLRLHVSGCVFMHTTADALLIDHACAGELGRLGSPQIGRLYDRDLTTVVTRLGASEVAAGENPITPKRLQVRCVSRAAFPFQVSAALRQDEAALTIHFASPLENPNMDYHVFVAHTRFGLSYTANIRQMGTRLDQYGAGQGEVTAEADGYALTIRFPHEALGEEATPVLLNVSIWDRKQETDPPDLDPLILTPLLITH